MTSHTAGRRVPSCVIQIILRRSNNIYPERKRNNPENSLLKTEVLKTETKVKIKTDSGTQAVGTNIKADGAGGSTQYAA